MNEWTFYVNKRDSKGEPVDSWTLHVLPSEHPTVHRHSFADSDAWLWVREPYVGQIRELVDASINGDGQSGLGKVIGACGPCVKAGRLNLMRERVPDVQVGNVSRS